MKNTELKIGDKVYMTATGIVLEVTNYYPCSKPYWAGRNANEEHYFFESSDVKKLTKPIVARRVNRGVYQFIDDDFRMEPVTLVEGRHYAFGRVEHIDEEERVIMYLDREDDMEGNEISFEEVLNLDSREW